MPDSYAICEYCGEECSRVLIGPTQLHDGCVWLYMQRVRDQAQAKVARKIEEREAREQAKQSAKAARELAKANRREQAKQSAKAARELAKAEREAAWEQAKADRQAAWELAKANRQADREQAKAERAAYREQAKADRELARANRPRKPSAGTPRGRRFCPNCGSLEKSAVAVCTACGYQLYIPPTKKPVKTCKGCGAQHQNSVRLCSCGYVFFGKRTQCKACRKLVNDTSQTCNYCGCPIRVQQ